MAENVNRYRADLRDMRFLLFEQFGLQELLGKEPYPEWGQEECEAVLDEVYKWVQEVPGPLSRVGDLHGCKYENGEVKTPPGFKEAWKSLNKVGWRSLSAHESRGGQGAPYSLAILVTEMMAGANTAFGMYSGLTSAVAEVVEAFGTESQKERFVKKLLDGVYSGTMCLTEPHAGSDVGSATTKATPLGDGRYKIEGTKIFISGGQHDLTENIIHTVLARTPGAPSGTKGLSLFLVPRNQPDGKSNNVVCASIEHKMGINGSATAVLNFGEGGDCIGELVGTEEMQGIQQMFKMMNIARIAVGVQGLSVAGSAYLNALDYARERKQGPSIKAWKDPMAPKVPIIQHANVRRLLLDMKSRVEGIRALIVKLSTHLDAERALRGVDDARADYHQGQVDLLVPIVKAYASDQGFDVTVAAIQVFGGAGYLKDHPVEQYCRDAKIFSIYEGTNHIQALDLVGRKLGQKGGMNFQQYLKDLATFVDAHKDHPNLGEVVGLLGKAHQVVAGSAMRLLGWFQAGKAEMVTVNANRFLRMMAVTTVAWMLCDGAIVADNALAALPEGHPDRDFYLGRRYSALYYCRLELPGVESRAGLMASADTSPLDIPDAGF